MKLCGAATVVEQRATVKTQEFIAGSRSSIQRRVKAWRAAHPGIVELRYTFREETLSAGRVRTKGLERKFVTARIDYEDSN